MRKSIFLLALLLTPLLVINNPQEAKALSGSDFQAGRIIDDGVFFNGQSMSAGEIQSFLNAKVPSCDTYGTQPYGNTTRAAYAASKGYSAPFTCLKDYRQDTPTKPGEAGLCNTFYGGNRSAAEIIYEVGLACGVSQRALIVLLEKEQSLITDTWPWSIQYRSATGYGCPDTAPCDAEYYGYFNQVYNAARQFKRYAKDSSLFRYRAFRDNYIQYNPNAGCGGTNVYIQNQATAGLYNFTPYQPNPSALANLYGTGDGCGAYGNRNFWRIYSDWFGSTYSNEHLWRVIRTNTDGRLFLQVGNTKRWIPSGEIYSDWTLDKYTVNVVTDSEFNSIPTIPELTRVGNNGQYNYIVDSGRKHYLPPSHEALWGHPNTVAAPVSSLLRTLPETEPVGRFIKDVNGNMYVMDNGVRRPISSSDALAWGASGGNIVGIGSPYLNAIPSGTAVARHISASGVTYVVDQGSLIRMPSAAISTAWGTSTYNAIGAQALSFMGIRANADYLMRATNSPHWYMVDGGKKYYVPNGDMIANWSVNSGSIITISPELFNQFGTAPSLSNYVRDTSNGAVYVLDGKKHYIPSNALLTTIMPTGAVINDVPSSRINTLPSGETYTKPLVLMAGTPHAYLLDQGKRYYIPTGDLYSAFNSWSGSQTLSATFLNSLAGPTTPLASVVKDGSNTHYFVDSGKKTPINSSALTQWANTQVPIISNELRDLIPNSTNTTITSSFIKNQNNTYLLDQGRKTAIPSSMVASYTGGSTPYETTNNTLPSNSGQASYMVKSRDDNKVWWINKNSKTEIDFARQLTLGYLTTPYQPATVSNAFLATVPTTASNNSLLIQKQGSGIKFLNFGHALGFPNSDTLVNAAGNNNPVLLVDDFTYDSFPVTGSISRVLKDDNGKLYLYEAGKRRWMTNYNAYRPYEHIPVTYLYGTTMALIPEGPAIN